MLSNYAGWNTVVRDRSPWAELLRAGAHVVSSAAGAPYVEGSSTVLIPLAVEAARAAEVVLLFVGTNPRGNVARCPSPPEGCVKTTEGEGVDRETLALPGVQHELVRAVVAANPNTVLVMLNGGPLAISWEKEHVPAIVEAYFPGEMGGAARISHLSFPCPGHSVTSSPPQR